MIYGHNFKITVFYL